MPLNFRDQPDGSIVVDAIADCQTGPREFYDIAQVWNPLGINPLMLVPQPLGADAVRQILAELERRRKEAGLR